MTIFNWINQINYEKKSWDSFSEAEQKTFNTFIINRWLSMDEELIQIVNYFQKYSIGLLEPNLCNAIRCKITTPTITNGNTKCKLKNLFNNALSTLNPPHNHVTNCSPTNGIALNKLVITVAPQKLI